MPEIEDCWAEPACLSCYSTMLETNDACWEATGYGGETVLYDCGLAAGFACCRIEDKPSCATNELLIAYHGTWCRPPTACLSCFYFFSRLHRTPSPTGLPSDILFAVYATAQ